LALVAVVPLMGACDWFTDFKRQPKIDPWEAYSHDSIAIFRGNPQNSVPITGTAIAGYQVSHTPSIPVIDSMANIPNPVPATEASLANGRKYYQINCAVCHGETGAGDGNATKYGFVPINLQTPVTQNRTDGYIFGMIRNGRGLMPSYNRIEEHDRWDIVNYIRGLQGKLGNAVRTGPLGVPGQTGAALPGATTLGPTRPVPYRPFPADTATSTPRPPAATDSTARRNPGA
jgi:mono/diheme cytochrome c family protein